MTTVVLGGGLLLGRLDEHLYVLGLAPLILGVLVTWADSRLHALSRRDVPIVWIGLGLAALTAGRWWEARLLYESQWVLAMGLDGSPAGDAFDDFLMDEMGFNGPAGFVALRLESGVRVVGDRGLDLGAIGGGMQWLFEVLACFWGGRLRFARTHADTNAEQFEHEAKGK